MFGPCQGSDCQGLQIPGVVRCLGRNGFVLAVIFLFLYCPKPPQACPREILATRQCQYWILLRRCDGQLCSVRCELPTGKVVLGTVLLSLFSAGSGGSGGYLSRLWLSTRDLPPLLRLPSITSPPIRSPSVVGHSGFRCLPPFQPPSGTAHFLRGRSRSQPVSALFPCPFLVVQLSARCYRRPARSARSAVVPTGTPPAPWPTSACPGRKLSYRRHLGPPSPTGIQRP